jgi:signal recognition particle subunit SRP54
MPGMGGMPGMPGMPSGAGRGGPPKRQRPAKKKKGFGEL